MSSPTNRRFTLGDHTPLKVTKTATGITKIFAMDAFGGLTIELSADTADVLSQMLADPEMEYPGGFGHEKWKHLYEWMSERRSTEHADNENPTNEPPTE